jgi:predicted transcriptional regulator
MLTEAELELMTILWKLNEGSVHDVIENLPKGRDLAYTSVSTILRILEQKNCLKSRKRGRSHIYVPKLSKAEYEGSSLGHLVESVFEGTPSLLVKRLIETEDLNSTEIAELRRLLDRKDGKDGKSAKPARDKA